MNVKRSWDSGTKADVMEIVLENVKSVELVEDGVYCLSFRKSVIGVLPKSQFTIEYLVC
jgi:hypothetical protein